MKTLQLLLLLLIIVALKAGAHDYQTVYANQVALFKNSANYRIKGLRIDSVKVASDIILYPFATIQEVSEGCFSPYKASWISEKVTLKPDGTNLFFNRDGGVITLKTQARLNESWIAFQRADAFRVEASVAAVELGNVLGLSDSVKTIAFRVVGNEGTTVDHALNKLKVKISKRYGFIETLNFYLFPDIAVRSPNDLQRSYSLVGLTNPKLGIPNLSWFEVNNFNPGDELHVHEHNFGDNLINPITEFDNRYIYKYLKRTNYADSVVYRYARRQSIKTVYIDKTTLETYNDTVRSVVRANPDFDQLPGEPIIETNSAYQMFMRNDEFIMKISPSRMNELYVGNGNCWSSIAGEGCLPEMSYIAGLGGPYYKCSGYIGESKERKLVYYKKGETEWGEKLLITTVPNFKTSDGLQVFPNPVSDVVTFQLNENTGTHEVRIYDPTGTLIKSKQFKGSSYNINLSDLKNGIYLYKVTSSNSAVQTGKLVIN